MKKSNDGGCYPETDPGTVITCGINGNEIKENGKVIGCFYDDDAADNVEELCNGRPISSYIPGGVCSKSNGCYNYDEKIDKSMSSITVVTKDQGGKYQCTTLIGSDNCNDPKDWVPGDECVGSGAGQIKCPPVSGQGVPVPGTEGYTIYMGQNCWLDKRECPLDEDGNRMERINGICYPIITCPNGEEVGEDGNCHPVIPPGCDTGAGYVMINGKCELSSPIDCDPGYVMINGKCELSSPIDCDPGYIMVNGKCELTNAPDCDPGYVMINGKCELSNALDCDPGYVMVNGKCELTNALDCDPGYVMINGKDRKSVV
jgi:hypothetical protein